jgi:hypothetical protein
MLADFRFNGLFGMYKHDSNNIYSLVCSGWRNGGYNEDSLCEIWKLRHPRAIVYPLFCIEEKKSRVMKYTPCWIIDKNDTLNTFLVRNGAIAGSLVIWNNKDPFFRQGYDSVHHRTLTVFINDSIYNRFLSQAKSAEQYAHDNKLGIWADDTMVFY